MPGVAEILPKLILDFVLAVDSTSTKEDITKILDHFELTPYFRIIGASDMPWDSKRYGKNSKSSRLKYIANQLRCDTKQCIMVGDAEKDIIAAKDNNMPVIIIPTETTKDNDLSSADLILSSFIELSCEVVRNVLKRIA